MSRPCAGRLFVLACCLVAARPVHARPNLPQVRVAVVVGNNRGNDPARTLRYAEQEVSRLAGLLQSAGDFASVALVPGGGRGEVEDALGRARARLSQAKAEGRQTLFLFYYSGHGDDEALELGSSRLPLRDLRGYLENLSAADVRLGFVDACQSGALTGVKGGRRVPGYQVRLADPGQITGMAIVTSSTANELSQESDDLRGSYFSHNVMAGLLGAADASGDGQVTLGELYQYAFRRTLASTAASLVGGQHPTYDYRMAGAGDVVLTRARGGDGRMRFPRETGATYTVLDAGRDEVIAEIAASSSEDLYLALPAGSYRVVRRALGSVKERLVGLVPGATSELEPESMMRPVLAENTLRKKGADVVGGIGSVQSPNHSNAVAIQVGALSNFLPAHNSPVPTVGLSLSRRLASWLDLRVRGDVAVFDAGDPSASSSVLRVAPALDALVPLVSRDRFSLVVGPSFGLPLMRQTTSVAGTTHSYGVSWAGVTVAAIRVSGSAWMTGQVSAGGESFRLDGSRTHRLTAGVALGVLHPF